jgi:acyl-CoA synthetase (NDP forming)
MRDLTALLFPRSVAVVGASSNLDSLAGRPIKNLLASGAEVTIYPVNPRRDEIAGLRCYPDLDSLPETPDVVLLLTPASAAADVLEAAGRRGVRAAIVISAGFAEHGPQGRAAQERLADIARRYDIALLGPNTIGLHDYRRGMPLSFVWFGRRPSSQDGSVAVITQSGSGMGALSDRLLDFDLPLGHGVATGNESDVSVTDLIEVFAERPEVRVIAAAFEQIRDGSRFIAVARRMLELGKPLIVYKLGRTASGSAMAASHTGSLAGEYSTIRAVLRQFGVIEIDNLEDFAPTISGALTGRFPAGRRFAAISSSGAATVIAADRADELGLELPEWSARAQEQIAPYLPSFSSGAHNPLDLTAQAAEKPFPLSDILSIALDEPQLDAVVAGMPSSTGARGIGTSDRLAEAAAGSRKPVYTFILTGQESQHLRDRQRDAGLAVFRNPETAVAVLERMSRFGIAQRRDFAPATPASEQVDPLPATEFEALRWLAANGVPVVPQELASSRESAVAAAERLTYPVVLKVNSPDIAHKTEAGGVEIDLGDADEVGAAFDRIMSAVAAAEPSARIEGVTVSPMIDIAAELIVGVHEDPTFGPVIAYGLGGVWAEVLRDVAIRALPITLSDVAEMTLELRGRALLQGFRGLSPVDPELLARTVQAIGDLAWQHREHLAGLDVNPIAITRDGRLMAVDAAVFAKD